MKVDIKKIEANVIDTVSAVTPWLAPLIPAYLMYTNMTVHLGYPWWIGMMGAAAVEFLGLSTVYTAVTFWQWNDSHKSEKAPLWVAVASGAFYVAIILTVNAMLEIFDYSKDVKILSHALLSLLSVDAAIVIALRAQHARRLSDKAEEKKERKATRESMKESEQESAAVQELNNKLNAAMMELNAVQASRSVEAMTNNKNGWHEQWSSYLAEHPDVSQRELAQVFSVSVGTVNSRLKALKSQVN